MRGKLVHGSSRIAVAIATALASLAAAAALVGLLGAPASAGDDDRLLPDLVTLPLDSDSQLSIEREGDRARLALDNTVGNQGEGPLQITASENDGLSGCRQDEYVALQEIYADSNGSGQFERGGQDVPVTDADGQAETQQFGCMRYHPKLGHQHWHVFNFTQYELRAWESPRVVAQVRKQGFCLFDNTPFLTGPGVAPRPYYTGGGCGFRRPEEPPELEGMSVGWSDVYRRDLPGQAINITGVPRGRYCLHSQVDPLGRISESDESNNSLLTPIRVAPKLSRVQIMPGECPAP